ncbi:MAG: winged helix-turn-helix transcriptional regulator [Planctomycetes bacterium]|nr:winged helix-turn-helix transcriptional regulator [Planctomycetota bacterium]
MSESGIHTTDETAQTDSLAAGHGEVDKRASHVVAEILKAAHRLRSTLSTHFSEFGLTDVRFAVLQIIRDSAPDGCSQSRLAEELDQSESSISTLVERMRSSHLLYRLRSKLDRRKRVLILTERSRDLLENAETCHDERMASLLSCFSAEQLEQFSSLLQQIQNRLAAETSQIDSSQNNVTPKVSSFFSSESSQCCSLVDAGSVPQERFNPEERSNPAA